MCKGCCYTIVEVLNSFNLYPTSILNKFKVIEHLQLWWMGIWMHTRTVTVSHIPLDHIQSDWAPSAVVNGQLDAYSHRYHHKCIPRCRRVGWKPRWCKCAKDATTPWLKQLILSNCIPHPIYTCTRWLSTFNCGGWSHGCILTLTPLPLQSFPQIWEGWLKLKA